MDGGAPLVSESIVNRRGGVESSLFMSCLALRKRLLRVPDFEQWLDDMEAEEQEEDADNDPVTSMWNMLRRGQPLLAIFNATNPEQPFEVQPTTVDNPRSNKSATMNFLNACIKQLFYDSSDCFIVRDLYGTDTTGFVKVLKVVNRVLDVAEQRGTLYGLASSDDPGYDGGAPKTHADNVIQEIVTTERDYVQHLETLQDFQTALQQANNLPGDTILNIFMNLNQLLDFQRRFLIRVEQQNSVHPDQQNWGQLFHMYKEQFKVYEPFIANQTRCTETVTREWDRIKNTPLPSSLQGMVETQSILLGFLLKPFQRLVKYPMLLEQLIKKGDYDEERINDLRLGVEATNGILTSANEAVAKEARVAAAHDLQVSVEDWKGHKLEEFGELLIFGGQTVLKGDGGKDNEREYKVYLFENILLCCKDVNVNKAKNKLSGKSAKQAKQRLQLKGRIWMNTITDILHYSKSNSYYLNIYWRADPAIENFIIRYINKEQRDKWKGLIEQQRRARTESLSQSPVGYSRFNHAQPYGVDQHHMSGSTLTNNTYYEDDDDDDDVRFTPGTNSISSNSGLMGSRNASNNSLGSRDRSATGGSGGIRIPPARFPMPEVHGANGAPLKIHTTLQTVPQGATTPDERGIPSYFSPTNESPASSFRASQSSQFHLPMRSSTSTNNSWLAEQNKHNTAPAVSRSPEDGAYATRSQRPSLPVGSSNGYTQPLRNRAASSSHVHTLGGDRKSIGQARTPSGDDPMPPLPPHMANMRTHPVNRSQSNSPTETYRNLRGQPQQPPPLNRSPQTFPNSAHEQRTNSQPGSTASRILNQGYARPDEQGEIQPPSQLRVKICFEPRPSHVTIVVPNFIRYQSLIERIDAKMERIHASAITRGTAKLKYSDSDGDLITMGNDDDVKTAIEEWTETNEAALRQGLHPDFELWWIEASSRQH